MKGQRTFEVSEGALVRRINRKLSREGNFGMALRKARGARAKYELGDFYVIDHETPGLVERDCDLEELGRRLGVLHHHEVLANS